MLSVCVGATARARVSLLKINFTTGTLNCILMDYTGDGQTAARGPDAAPPERFYPARGMIPNLTNEKKKKN
jgi:hypothetical protein